MSFENRFKLLHGLYRTWFTGVLYILAFFGYIFYAFLLLYRIMQQRVILSIFSVSIAVCATLGLYLFVPMHPQGETVSLTIEKGSSLKRVAADLRQLRVVPSGTVLLVWMKVRGFETRVQAGRHEFREYEGIRQAARHLLKAIPADIVITIPEGLTIEQTARKFADGLAIDTAEFIRLCHDSLLIESFGFSGGSLEGYLFPDTYRIEPNTTVRDIIKRMIAHFEQVYALLPSSERYSRHQIVTLASIVEKEAMVPYERGQIAGVFHNRLLKGWPLGADPTVRYIYRKFSGPLRVSELQNPSPYNTRIHAGLPPGPICSPGRGALEAAITPMVTNDLFFVALWDGSGRHDFSATNAEHDRKKIEIRRQNELRIRAKTKGQS
jgi:UPF0755 protein